MTEAEWLASTKPYHLAAHLRLLLEKSGMVGAEMQLRRTRLAAVACCHRIPAAVMPVDGPTLVDAVEAWVDAGSPQPPLVGELVQRFAAERDRLPDGRQARRVGQLASRRYFAVSALATLGRSYDEPGDQQLILLSADEAAHTHPRQKRAQAQATATDVIRCVFGYPFQPTTFDPSWQTPTVVAVAVGAYADRAFDRLPILANALEDAGCDASELLAHLRGPGPHARGCWALDAVLGKT